MVVNAAQLATYSQAKQTLLSTSTFCQFYILTLGLVYTCPPMGQTMHGLLYRKARVYTTILDNTTILL